MIVSMNGSTDGFAWSRPTALHRLDERLYIISTNGSASSLRTAVRTAVRTTLRTVLQRLYDSMTTLRRLCVVYGGSTWSLRRLYHCPYSRTYNRPYERLCIVSTNGCIVSMNGSATALQRLCNGSTTALRMAL